MNTRIFVENIFLALQGKTYFLDCDQGEFKEEMFSRRFYFKYRPLEERIDCLEAVSRLLNVESGKTIEIMKKDYLNIYGNIFAIKRRWFSSGFKVKRALGKIETKEEHYNLKLRLGYVIKNSDVYLVRKVEPFEIDYEGKQYRFKDAQLGTRMQYANGKLDYSPLIIMNAFTHPGLPQEEKEMQTLCIGDIKYESIKERYKNNLLKQVLHLFSIGESALKAERYKQDCYQPLERSWLYNG